MKNWNYLYKIDYNDFSLCSTNSLYTPTVNTDGSVLCIDYCPDPGYRKNSESVTPELIDYFFKKELRYVQQFQGHQWAPALLDIQGTKIYVEFNKETLNQILLTNRSLDNELPNWKHQLLNIMIDIDKLGYYKLALYPHSFFIGKDGNLKVIDYYTFLEKSNPLIPLRLISGLIGQMSRHRFAEATVGDDVDFSIFFNESLRQHLGQYWKKDNPFPGILEILKARN